MRCAIWLVALLSVVSSACGAFVPDPAQRNVDLPIDAGLPVPVTIDFFLLDVSTVNGATESFTASLYLDLKWKDARMAFDEQAFGSNRAIYPGAAAAEQIGRMWSPLIEIENLHGEPTQQDQVLTIYADGTVEFEVWLSGEFASEMALWKFPFDRQVLEVRIESFLWDQDEVKLVRADKGTHFNESLSIREWKIESVGSDVVEGRYPTDIYSRFVARVMVAREPWFYIWAVVFPLVLVTFFAITCFFWDQQTLSERVAQVLTCLLTVTAQSLVVEGELPKISYFTLIDYAFLATYATLLAVTIESIVVKNIDDSDTLRADRVDRKAAWVIAGAYLLIMGAIFSIR